MPETPNITKAALRDTARQTRSALTPARITAMSEQVCSNLLGILDDTDPLMVYMSKPLEVHTHALLADLLKKKRRVVVPIIEQETRSLRLSYIRDPDHLIESTFHVLEPIGNEIPARPEEVKIVIVPILAFDRRGHRLGYGAGYYDRFLSAHPHLIKIGLAFSCQEVAEVPAEQNDVRMDVVITERDRIMCRDD